MNDSLVSKHEKLFHFIEWALAIIGAVFCLVDVFLFASLQPNDLWPIPGFYFIEISMMAIFGVASRIEFKGSLATLSSTIPWIASGILLPIVILGIFSIGIFLFPAMLAFLLVGLIADLRIRRGMGMHAGAGLVALLVQTGIMVFFLLIVTR